MDGRITTCPSSLLPSTTRRSGKNWTVRGGARQGSGPDQIRSAADSHALSLTIRRTYIRVAALQMLAASRRRGPWSRAPNPSVPSQRESERGRGRERDRTYFHFSPVFAHGGNQRQLALVAREADQIVVCVVGHLLEFFCQKSGLGLEESLPFRRRKHGKSNSCVQASSRHRNPPAQQQAISFSAT